MGDVILCDAASSQSGGRPYFIGYVEMVDGYWHAWTETSPSGQKRLRHSRTADHPVDPRCPACADGGERRG